MNHLLPFILSDFVLIKIWSWVACGSPKQKDRLSIINQDMRISWSRNFTSILTNFSPTFTLEVVREKIVQLFASIMASEDEHLVFIDYTVCSVPGLRPHYLFIQWNYFTPFVCRKVEFVKVILVLSIISPKYVHVFIVNHCRMWVSWSWWRPSSRTKNFLPRVLQNIIFKKVVHSIESIISAKNEYRIFMYNRNMPISWRWWNVLSIYLGPFVLFYAVFKEVIFAVLTIVTSKDVDGLFIRNTCVKRSRTRRDAIRFNFIPTPSLCLICKSFRKDCFMISH